MQRRAQFKEVLSSSQSGLTTGRYLRLMGLALCEMIGSATLSIYVVAGAIRNRSLQPWVDWAFVHASFGRIGQFPLILLPPHYVQTLIGAWWITPIGSVCFFAFFGFGEEAIAEYKRIGRWFMRTVLRREISDNSRLPTFVGYVFYSGTLSTSF